MMSLVREMLLQWQSEKKSVKGHHHTNILTPLNGTRGVKRKEGAKGLFNTTGKIRDRTIMRELFQQDIDRTVAEILKEEEEEGTSGSHDGGGGEGIIVGWGERGDYCGREK